MKRRQGRRLVVCGLALLIGTSLAGPARAQESGTVLEVTGRIERTVRFTLDDLRALGSAEIRTSTAWTGGIHVFTGVPVRNVLAALGPVTSRTIIGLALNDYQAEIPISDFFDYEVILAWSMDGAMLTRRDKGPLWIVYPRDQYPQLQDGRFEHRWIWQLNRLQLP